MNTWDGVVPPPDPEPILGRTLVFWVTGSPAPQGSKKSRPIYKGRGTERVFTGKVATVESSAAVKPWRQDVAAAAEEAIAAQSWPGLDGPAHVRATFYVPRPSSAPKRVLYPFRKPDVDKYLRATLDALTTAGVVADDARFVDTFARKRFAQPGRPTGALIVVSEVTG